MGHLRERACLPRRKFVMIGFLRSTNSSDFDISGVSRDLIEFLMALDFMQTRTHLLHLFMLCCLCVTSSSPQYPAVTIGEFNTTGHSSRLNDVVLPSPSYMSSVPNSIFFCCTDFNLHKFILLSASFGRSAFSPSYDTWFHVDIFGRPRNYKLLLNPYRSLQTCSKGVNIRTEASEVSSVGDDSAVECTQASPKGGGPGRVLALHQWQAILSLKTNSTFVFMYNSNCETC